MDVDISIRDEEFDPDPPDPPLDEPGRPIGCPAKAIAKMDSRLSDFDAQKKRLASMYSMDSKLPNFGKVAQTKFIMAPSERSTFGHGLVKHGTVLTRGISPSYAPMETSGRAAGSTKGWEM